MEMSVEVQHLGQILFYCTTDYDFFHVQIPWIDKNRARNQVERFFNRIKQCRRVATRYDKLAANYLAFVQLASIRLWLRVYESASSLSSALSQ